MIVANRCHFVLRGYNGFLIRQHQLRVYCSVLYLHPHAGLNDPGFYAYRRFGCEYKHQYRVIRLIEIDGEINFRVARARFATTHAVNETAFGNKRGSVVRQMCRCNNCFKCRFRRLEYLVSGVGDLWWVDSRQTTDRATFTGGYHARIAFFSRICERSRETWT